MTKLHEILAVEGDVRTTAQTIVTETIGTFQKRNEHFTGKLTTIAHFEEGDRQLDAEEHKAMTTTVPEKLGYVVGPIARWMDIKYQKEETNQRAHADLEVDGKVIAEKVPAGFLLGMENYLRELREMYAAIPTLQPGPTWDPDTERKGQYRSRYPEVRQRTRKAMQPVILVEATQHHPAQVKAIEWDKPIANVTDTVWSGMMSSADKSDLLGRLDTLIREVKKARQRANGTDVKKQTIGKALFDYIHGDLVA